MFNDIQIKRNDNKYLTLFDTHDLTINRDDANNAEIVIHPCNIGRISIRFAKDPYWCKLQLANGEWIEADLGDSDDWGNIQQMNNDSAEVFKDGKVPEDWDKRIGWGNDEDGHTEIVRVELFDGVPEGTEVPLEEFKRDVADFIIYHEG